MTEQPTTAAGRACLEQWDDDPDMQALLLVHVLAIEAEERSFVSTQIRQRVESLGGGIQYGRGVWGSILDQVLDELELTLGTEEGVT